MEIIRAVPGAVCLVLLTGCANIDDFYNVTYETLRANARSANPPEDTPFQRRPMTYREYEAERRRQLEADGSDTGSTRER